MDTASEASDFLVPLLWLAAVLVIISRLLRIARLSTSGATDAPSPPASPRRPWGTARRLDKLNDSTALTRAQAELLHSKIDEVQARSELDRLLAQLQPPTPPQPTRKPASDTPPGLTLDDIERLLRLVDLDDDARAELLRLAASLIAEKHA